MPLLQLPGYSTSCTRPIFLARGKIVAFELESLISSSVAQDPSSRVVTRARIGFRARVTYFELGCPETNIDPNVPYSTAYLREGTFTNNSH